VDWISLMREPDLLFAGDGRIFRLAERLKKGGRFVVLTTPETLESAATAPLFERARPVLLCIDEAHCISEWGHDFRPSYLRLGNARKRLGNPPVLALTATATPRVREDIAERLRLDNPRVLVAPAHRENLGLTVDIVPGAAKFPAAARRIKRLQRPGIIYCARARQRRTHRTSQ
jgi:ATP-dependent DNA helicase RecQ